MRKIAFLLMCLPLRMLAQEEENNAHKLPGEGPVNEKFSQYLSVGVGMLTSDFVLDGYSAGRPVTRDYEKRSPRVSYLVSYKCQITQRIRVGVTASYERMYGDWLDNQVYDNYYLTTTVKGAFDLSCYTVAMEFSSDYAVDGPVRMYLTGGLGYTYISETDQYLTSFYNPHYNNGVNDLGPLRQTNNRIHFNGHFAPFGVRFGNRLSGFFELGFGYKGVICGGINYKFSQPKP